MTVSNSGLGASRWRSFRRTDSRSRRSRESASSAESSPFRLRSPYQNPMNRSIRSASRGGQLGVFEIRKPPAGVFLTIGKDPAGHNGPAALVFPDKPLHGPADEGPLIVRGYLVQAVEQEDRPSLFEGFAERVGGVFEVLFFQIGFDEVPEVTGGRVFGRLGRQPAAEVPKDHGMGMASSSLSGQAAIRSRHAGPGGADRPQWARQRQRWLRKVDFPDPGSPTMTSRECRTAASRALSGRAFSRLSGPAPFPGFSLPGNHRLGVQLDVDLVQGPGAPDPQAASLASGSTPTRESRRAVRMR